MNRIYVVLPEHLGKINPNIYGHFAEHIGGVIYDGIWVGESSSVPNIGGIRRDIVELLREINPPVLRWPGGCFSETYNWRDGIGPRDSRPTTVNWWYTWDKKLESNHFGTHEFINFCRLVGAEPYLAANVSTISALETRNWIEYCNMSDGTTLASLRASNGSPQPFGVKYWGIGNENWGGGGNFTPDDYCTEFRRYGTAANSLDRSLRLIACGASGDDVEWTKRFFEKWADLTIDHFTPMYGYSVHYYCGTSGSALSFDRNQWYELLKKAQYMEDIIVQHRGVMDAYDPDRRIGLIVDEWGCWHPDGSGPSKGGNLFEQQSTMRDALIAALTLNIFNNHCDKVAMANVAQLVNNLHSLFLACGDDLIVTPNYHVFDMFKGHQGAIGVRTVVEAEDVEFATGEGAQKIQRISCSSSVTGDRLTVTIVNTHYDEPTEIELELFGSGRSKLVRKICLSSEDPHAHNTLDEPGRVQPKEVVQEIVEETFTISLPPASVTLLEFELKQNT